MKSGSPTVRRATASDMDSIYEMGFDTWGEKLPLQEYIHLCQNSAKYQSGSWYALESRMTLVSSMIVYQTGFSLPERCLGFGSLSTYLEHRGKGHARQLLQQVLDLELCQSAPAIFLHSDIDPEFYAKLGFRRVRTHKGGVCMVRQSNSKPFQSFEIPDYF